MPQDDVVEELEDPLPELNEPIEVEAEAEEARSTAAACITESWMN